MNSAINSDLPRVGQTITFTAGSRAGVCADVVSVCGRHGYATARVIKGNGEFRRGTDLHVTAAQSFEVTP